MRIYIPTLGRADRQHTFARLPKEWKRRTWFVIHERERKLFGWHQRRVVVDKVGVCHFRQAAVDHALDTGCQKLFMLDDDLNFNVRAADWSALHPKLLPAKRVHLGGALQACETKLERFAAVGLDARFGNNRRPDKPWIVCSRMMYAFGLRPELLEEEGIRFDRFFFWEDFHVTLELLKRGYANAIYTQCVVGSATNSKGGVSLYRSPDRLKKVRKDFVAHHAPWVTAVEKPAKSWGGGIGDTVPDVRVAWRKCYLAGKKARS